MPMCGVIRHVGMPHSAKIGATEYNLLLASPKLSQKLPLIEIGTILFLTVSFREGKPNRIF
jgi:hypothetical protein